MNAGCLQEREPRYGGSPVPASPQGPWIGSMCSGNGGLDLAVIEAYGAGLAWCSDPNVAEILPGSARLCALGNGAVPQHVIHALVLLEGPLGRHENIR